MPLRNPKEVFVLLLTNVRNAVQRETAIYEEMSKLGQDADIKQAFEARVFLTGKTLTTLDECFKLLGEKPMKTNDRLHDVFVEELRREFKDIESPAGKRMFILAKAQQLTHIRIGEYLALIAAADTTGAFAIGMLIESALADKLAFVERTRTMITRVLENEPGARLVA